MNIIKNKSSGIKLNSKNELLGILGLPQVYVFVPFLFIISITNAEEICQTGWIPFNSRCYQIVVGSQGQFYTYKQALENCNNSNGTLGSVPDNYTLQFLTKQIYEKWKGFPYYSQCSQQVDGCNHTRHCDEYLSCLNFWIGLSLNKTCVGNCDGESIRDKREGWFWSDGSNYNADETPWRDDKPNGVQNKIRLGVFDFFMKFYIGDQINPYTYGYICSKDVERVTRHTQGSSVTQEIEEETTSDMKTSKDTSLIIGLAAGLGGGVLLIIVIVGLIIIIINTIKKRKSRSGTKKMILAPTASLESDYNGSLYPYGSRLTMMAPNKPNKTQDVIEPYSQTSTLGLSNHLSSETQEDHIEPYSQSSTLGLSNHLSVGNTKSQEEQIEPYSQTSTLGLSNFSSEEIEPYGVTRPSQEEIEPYGTSPGKFVGVRARDSREDLAPAELDEYANGDQVQIKSKKSNGGGIYGMFNSAKERLSNFPVYAVPDKTKKTEKKKKPTVKAKPKN